MKAKPASLTCGCNSLRVLVSRIMARLASILSINSSIRTHTLAGFLSSRGSAFVGRTIRIRAISGAPSSHQILIRWCPISCCRTRRWPTQLTSVGTHFAPSLIREWKPLSRSPERGKMSKAARLAWMVFSTSFNRSQISRTFRKMGQTRSRFCSSIDLNPRPNFGQLIFHNSPQSIRSIAGQSGDSDFAIVWKHEATTALLEEQRYAIYRDLTSWVASFGGVISDNKGVKEYGVLFSLTLKAFPKFGVDLNFDPSSEGQ